VGGLEYLVTVGFRPEEVLAIATMRAVAALGLDAVTGRLAPGYDADSIVVDGDPRAHLGARQGSAASSPEDATACPTAAGSTSARRARRSPHRTTTSTSGCSPRRERDARRNRTPRRGAAGC